MCWISIGFILIVLIYVLLYSLTIGSNLSIYPFLGITVTYLYNYLYIYFISTALRAAVVAKPVMLSTLLSISVIFGLLSWFSRSH